jgi:hypothetical protein
LIPPYATVIAAIIIVAIGVFAWRTFNPGPLAFARGSTVAFADYKEANPTGVPTDLAKADIVKRVEYLAKLRTVWSVTPRRAALSMPAVLPSRCRSVRSIRPTLPPTRTPASAITAIRIFSTPRLYPAMPYTSYTFMTNADVLAIKAYLFSLPAVHRPNQGDTGGYPGAGDLSAQHSRSCLIPAGNDRDAGARVAESGRRSC